MYTSAMWIQSDKCAPLLAWFRANNGYVNPALEFKHDDENGYHFVTKERMAPKSKACVCPFPVTLSHLNLLPKPPARIPSYHATSACSGMLHKLDNSVVAHFFLIEERLKGSKSFWHPYIDALPADEGFTTPLYFEPEDMVWVYGTQMYNKNVPEERTAVNLRIAEWRKNWKAGLRLLKDRQDVSKYTWHLYKWAATVFSSRSFTSQIYTSGEDVYPVLYPVLDIFNHRFGEQVEWNIPNLDERSFIFSLDQAVEAGQQVFNNYAPKSNAELLLGYGFCIENSPCDEVGMRLAQPPQPIHDALRQTIPWHYESRGFDPAEFSFEIRGSKHYEGGFDNRMVGYGVTCMRGISEELALTLQMLESYHIIPQSKNPKRKEAETWYAACDTFLNRLRDVRGQIRRWDNKLPPKPQNKRQIAAKIYRDGQLTILDEVIGEFEAFLEPLENGMDTMERFGRVVQDKFFRTYS